MLSFFFLFGGINVYYLFSKYKRKLSVTEGKLENTEGYIQDNVQKPTCFPSLPYIIIIFQCHFAHSLKTLFLMAP